MHGTDIDMIQISESINIELIAVSRLICSVWSAVALSQRVRRIYSCMPGRRAKILTHIQAERVSCNVTSGLPRCFVRAIVGVADHRKHRTRH